MRRIGRDAEGVPVGIDVPYFLFVVGGWDAGISPGGLAELEDGGVYGSVRLLDLGVRVAPAKEIRFTVVLVVGRISIWSMKRSRGKEGMM